MPVCPNNAPREGPSPATKENSNHTNSNARSDTIVLCSSRLFPLYFQIPLLLRTQDSALTHGLRVRSDNLTRLNTDGGGRLPPAVPLSPILTNSSFPVP